MKDNEIRQNRATCQWVIFATTRRKRPKDFQREAVKPQAVPPREDGCPFCPGNEGMLPQIIFESKGPAAEGWLTRVLPNKFPALTPVGATERYSQGIYLAMGGFGRHEVIIESPLHNMQIAAMSPEKVGAVIETYHRRYADLMAEHGNMMTIIFRNHGLLAGTSLIHPHSQIIVTGMVPQHIRWREEAAQRYFDEWGRCVYCDILGFEMKDRRRVVFENPSFLAFIPYAADVPFEIWIMPKNHEADFGSISDTEKEDLAAVLRSCLSRLHDKLKDPDYNYVINTAARFRAWYLQVRPRLTTRAGFEIGSGISINPSLPEEDAEFLGSD